ncbi:energy-coupling factor transporter transmembrane component T [Clostridium senegalense]|uniref:Energy-coupling factor transporter transmembrane protein EcfT n=1 Tax=Clostridium senegalense TaxID=1465809 RepID=A0A6M0H1R1_9CLOT|nr:energy-coupling factor transporter transmembrane component T [Clostridium senegalense]NEU04158.1 energy-coupling factor transporter transmembrane protein EcfT [Clostridium senegalense]
MQKIHPLTSVFLIATYIIVALKLSNPVYLALIFFSVLLLAYIDNSLKSVLNYGKMIIPFAVMIIILNPILVHNGQTILYQGTFNFPVLGPMIITKEAILFGILNGFRIITITIIFGFGNLVIHPDRAFGFFSKIFKKSALLMSMTIRLFPTMMKSYENISEIEKLRGNELSTKDMKKSIKNSGNIVNILFLSSLEDSQDMAESMYSRGYGALKKRSTYFAEIYTAWDFTLIFICISILVYLEFITFKGFNSFNFYPKVDGVIEKTTKVGLILCVMTFIPAFINWGWKNWK